MQTDKVLKWVDEIKGELKNAYCVSKLNKLHLDEPLYKQNLAWYFIQTEREPKIFSVNYMPVTS